MRRPPPTVSRSYAFTAARPTPTPNSAPVQPRALTTRPTPELQRQHQVQAPQIDSRAFRPGWRICTRLDSLLASDRIGREAYEAAREWRRWAETVAPCRVQHWDVKVDCSIVPNDAGALHRLATATRLRQAAEALGPLRIKILEQLLVHDCSWAELGRLLRLSDKTAAERAVEAVIALADWRAGRAVGAAPETRFRNQPSSW